MTVKRRRLLPNFEACSVALFATIALSGSLSSRSHFLNPPGNRAATSQYKPQPEPVRWMVNPGKARE